ncbi:hypothetical protein HHI36_020085, partial [Cryptolaemus montrouzieri]
RGKSPTRVLYQTLTRIIDFLNDKKRIVLMCADLSKAFDILDHDILYQKLNKLGIRGLPLEIIRSNVTGRSQTVVERDPVT